MGLLVAQFLKQEALHLQTSAVVREVVWRPRCGVLCIKAHRQILTTVSEETVGRQVGGGEEATLLQTHHDQPLPLLCGLNTDYKL